MHPSTQLDPKLVVRPPVNGPTERPIKEAIEQQTCKTSCLVTNEPQLMITKAVTDKITRH